MIISGFSHSLIPGCPPCCRTNFTTKDMTRKIPATIITGFLGAGKTTLIRNLVEQARGRKLALIINEFGELAVDGQLLKDCDNPDCGEEDIYELANGCICCTVADDFLPTIERIIGLPEPPDHIVIETSGLALPKPLVQAFNWPEVRTRVTVDGVVAVIDGPAVADGRFADDPERVALQRQEDEQLDHDNPLQELYEDQLACADLVVVNKMDLLNAHGLDDVIRDLKPRLRDGVQTVKAAEGRIDSAVLLGLEASAEEDLESRPSHHDDEPDHDHDDFESFTLTLAPVSELSGFVTRLRNAVVAHDILRVKGFVNVKDKDMRLVIQGVGSRFQHYYDQPWDQPRETRLVVIGRSGLDRAAVTAAMTP